MTFKLTLSDEQIIEFSRFSAYDLPDLENKITNEIVPNSLNRGYINRNEFLDVCRWKSRRPKKHYESNSEDFIQEITSICISAKNEKLKIEVLTLLQGVNYPVASVFLHFLFQAYPIMDFRALESLGYDRNKLPAYNFKFWWEYTLYCREMAQKYNLSMREFDRALWNYSKMNAVSST